MTRDEAKEISLGKMICKQSHIPFLRLIDKIYDDFEKQIEEVAKENYICGSNDGHKAFKEASERVTDRMFKKRIEN